MKTSPSKGVPDPQAPVNPAAERSVLGAMIDDELLLPEILASGLRREHFSVSDHRRIFDAIGSLQARGLPVDSVSVANELGNDQHDCALIADLTYGVVLAKNHILHHASIVRTKATLRNIQRFAEWLGNSVDESTNPHLLIAEAMTKLENLKA